jgi:Fe2+ or Zn2+ uptake regulation protein
MVNTTRKELLDLLKGCSPRTRKTVLRLVEGKASQDGVSFVKENLSFLEQDGTVRAVEIFGARTCDFGHVLDQQTRLVSVCAKCGRYTCSSSSPQCSWTCSCCGNSFCRSHVSTYADGESYCARCRPRKWFRLFFDLKKKG